MLTRLALLLCRFAAAAADSEFRGIVTDWTEAPVPGARVELRKDDGWVRTVETTATGAFTFAPLMPGTYQVTVVRNGFGTVRRQFNVGAGERAELVLRLKVADQRETIEVQDEPVQVSPMPSASQSVGRRALAELPASSPGSGLNEAIVLSSPGIAADSNGFFHPLGDHSQVSFVIDGQPIGDQRNKVFSTSIPVNAIQSMEIVSGSPSAEYGDKTSLVVDTQMRSGLGEPFHGSLLAHYGSFGSVGEELTVGTGSAHWGNFFAFNAERSGRFFDTPEFRPLHAIGNSGTIFDRLDAQPDGHNTFHLNLLAARNWLQVPNTYDQPEQDQRQKVVSFNIAPGYQRVVQGRGLLTVNLFVRRDVVDYYPSRDPLRDLPATLGQERSLTNFGGRAGLAMTRGRHNWKIGGQATRTSIDEHFSLGITDPQYNPPDSPDFLPGLLPYDLTRGGSPFRYAGKADIDQAAAYLQDTFTVGNLAASTGLRVDWYRGLTRGTGVQPRVGLSYRVAATGTVVRAGYSRTMETPVNENLVVSSSTGEGGLAGSLYGGAAEQKPIPLGRRHQFDAGVQQPLGRWAAVTVDYFRKYTRNAYDFDVLFSTPLAFPIGWAKSKLDGVSARISTTSIHGFRAHATMGHANARFFGPEVGGIVFNSNLSVGAYRQDHDQVYQQTVHVSYDAPKRLGTATFTWRYDSGLVVGAVNNMEDALELTAAQQSAIGLYCGAERASLSHRIVACPGTDYGAERIHILAPGEANPDRNPPRAKARHLLDASWGIELPLRSERLRAILRLSALNLTGRQALYNFLSPFSGTHCVTPRSFRVQAGIAW